MQSAKSWDKVLAPLSVSFLLVVVAGLRLGVDTYSSGSSGVDHRVGQDRAGRPDSSGRAARLSRLCTARELSVDSRDLLRRLTPCQFPDLPRTLS